MPVLPANAAKGAGDLSDTTWLFREQLSLPPWVDSLASTLDLEVSFAFKDNPDFIFTDIFYNADTKKLHYVSEDAQSVFVYDFNTGSWVNDIFRDVGFTPIQSDNPYFSLWIESNASLQSGDYTYLDPGDGTDPGPYETIIVLDGIVFTFSSNRSYPHVTCTFLSDRIHLTDGHSEYYWFYKTNSQFLGLDDEPRSDDPHFKPGDEAFYFQGSPENNILELFATYASDFSGSDEHESLASLFVPIFNAVSYFFAVEFIPDFSFGRVFLMALLVGLFLFFLKVTK